MEPLSTTESSPEFGVYTGVWTNWSYSQIRGKTLTLDRRDGDLLIAFVALFVTIAGTSFWRVTCFAIHYYFSSEAPQDGLYHQRQAILRNSANSASGLWHLIRTFWAWRRNGIKPVSRVLPMILYAALCLCVFGAASGFSSKVVTSVGNEVLISSASFGALSSSFPYNTTNLQKVDWTAKMVVLRIRETTSYIRYAERCYTNGSNLVGCDTFVKPCLASQVVRDAECPFKSNICRSNDQNIYLDTGLLDLSDDFGMNVPPSQRFQFRVATHCAPLKTEGYKKYDSSGYTEYFYGETREATYQYPDHPSIWDYKNNPSYTISVQSTCPQNGTFASERSAFIPHKDLFRTDADLDLVFLSANGVLYAGTVDDPWYSAHRPEESTVSEYDSRLLYGRDEPATVLGCVKQYQICNPRLPKAQSCMPLQGSQDLKANAGEIVENEQEASRLNFYLTSRIPQLPQLREVLSISVGSSLALSYSPFGGIVVPPPDYQWQVDVEHWHSIYLASLQGSAINIAEGPSDLKLRELMQKPQNKEQKSFCRIQKVLSNKHTNFSVFGLVLILTAGGFVILLSWFIEHLFAFIQKRRNLDAYARLEWATNEVLQLQRMAHEQLGMGTWSACDAEVPITGKGEKLAVLDLGALKHPRLVAPPKGFEHEMAEPKRDDLETGGQEVEAEQATGDLTAKNN